MTVVVLRMVNVKVATGGHTVAAARHRQDGAGAGYADVDLELRVAANGGLVVLPGVGDLGGEWRGGRGGRAALEGKGGTIKNNSPSHEHG